MSVLVLPSSMTVGCSVGTDTACRTIPAPAKTPGPVLSCLVGQCLEQAVPSVFAEDEAVEPAKARQAGRY